MKVVEVDDIIYVDKDSKVKIVVRGKGDQNERYFILRPITTNEYYQYLQDEKETVETKKKLLSSCIIEPSMTVDDLGKETPGLFLFLYQKLLSISFLQQMDSEKSKIE